MSELIIFPIRLGVLRTTICARIPRAPRPYLAEGYSLTTIGARIQPAPYIIHTSQRDTV